MTLAISSESMRSRMARRWLNAVAANGESAQSRRLRAAMNYLEKRIRRECEHDHGPILNLIGRSIRVCIYCGHEADCDY